MKIDRPAVLNALKKHVADLRRDRDNLRAFAKNFHLAGEERERRAADLTEQILRIEAEIAHYENRPAPFP